MKRERYRIINTVHLYYKKGTEVLLSKRQNTGFKDGEYVLVGGHVEQDETLVEAVIREVKEELGIVIHSSELSLAHVMHRRKCSNEDDDRVEFFFNFNPRQEYDIYNKETEFCSELSWFPLDTMPTNTADYIINVIENIEKNNLYSTFGW